MSSSAQTAIMKYHSPGGLNSTHLFLIVHEAGKSEIMVLADSVADEGSFPSIQTITF